jgi:hypothetical protein
MEVAHLMLRTCRSLVSFTTNAHFRPFIPRPSTSTSNCDLMHSSPLDQDMHVEEHVFSGPQSPHSFCSSDDVVSEAIEPASLPIPSILDHPEYLFTPNYPQSLDTSFIGPELSTSFGSLIDSGWDGEDYTPTDTIFGDQISLSGELELLENASQHAVSHAAPSSSISATPAHTSSPSSIHILGNCRWVDRGGTCNELLSWKSVSAHLRDRHVVRYGSEQLVTCLWLGCSSIMKKESLVRHIRERHLGARRIKTRHSRGSQP